MSRLNAPPTYTHSDGVPGGGTVVTVQLADYNALLACA